MTDHWWEHSADRASARRAVAWALHPDTGGDPREFTAAMAAIERRFSGPCGIPSETEQVLIRRTRRGALGSRTRSARRTYARLRDRFPLARRGYFHL